MTTETTFDLEAFIDCEYERWSSREQLTQMLIQILGAELFNALGAKVVYKEHETRSEFTYRHRLVWITWPTENSFEIRVGGKPELDQVAIAPNDLREKLALSLHGIRSEKSNP